MSETSYDQCHTSYRGYMDEEINTAREMLRKYGKPCSDAVKELRLKTSMSLSECGVMLRCLWRDMQTEQLEAENAKLRELLIDVSEEVPWSFMDTTKYYMPLRADKLRKLLCRMRELGVEVGG